MNFYQLLQLDPSIIKNLMNKSDNKKEKQKYRLAMILRSLLIVLFAVVFISTANKFFGNQNSCMAVVIFCTLLGVRFVDFGYRIQDSLLNLAIVFLLLLFSPVLAYYSNVFVACIIHFISFFIILMITCDKPEMGNAGLFNFAYIFLSGNPATGHVLFQRFILTIIGYLICASIFYFKHKHKNKDITFKAKIKEYNTRSHKHHWQIKLSLGIALILSLSKFIGMERFMWAGFACGSLLADHVQNPNILYKFWHRLFGVIIGSSAFYIVFLLVPKQLQFLIGPMGGFCLGLCTEYRHKTAINCFGALSIASSLYGLQDAVLLRIFNTIIGIIFAVIFFYVYDKFVYPSHLKNQEA